jgi:hypothetical protein
MENKQQAEIPKWLWGLALVGVLTIGNWLIQGWMAVEADQQTRLHAGYVYRDQCRWRPRDDEDPTCLWCERKWGGLSQSPWSPEVLKQVSDRRGGK